MAEETHLSGFDQHSFASAYPPGVENNFWNLARDRVVEIELERATRAGLINRNAHILEVGCGPGIVVRYLRDHGWAVFGAELGQATVMAGLEQVVWTTRSATELDDEFRKSITCILLLDVIEHIADDAIFVADIVRAFPACNCFIVTVPARSEVWSNYDDYYGHFRRYDRALLSESIIRAGLALVHQKYFFHSLYVVAAVINLLKLQRKVVITPTKWPTFDRLVAALLRLENHLLPSIFPGLSLIGTAVRR